MAMDAASELSKGILAFRYRRLTVPQRVSCTNMNLKLQSALRTLG